MSKFIITCVVLGILIAGGYVFYEYQGKSSLESLLVTISPGTIPQSLIDGDDSLGAVLSIETIAFKKEVLDSLVFLSLKDNSVSLEQIPVGRVNPFRQSSQVYTPQVIDTNKKNNGIVSTTTETSTSTTSVQNADGQTIKR